MPKGNCEFKATGGQYFSIVIFHLGVFSLVTVSIRKIQMPIATGAIPTTLWENMILPYRIMPKPLRLIPVTVMYILIGVWPISPLNKKARHFQILKRRCNWVRRKQKDM